MNVASVMEIMLAIAQGFQMERFQIVLETVVVMR